jgi:hypothetical protein
VWSHAIEETREASSHGGSSGETNADAQECHAKPVAEDQFQNVLALSAQCHADSKFVGSLGNRIIDDAVSSHDAENQCQGRENSQQPGTQAPWRRRGGHSFLHRPYIVKRLIGNHVADGLANRGDQRAELDLAANGEKHPRRRTGLRVGKIEFRVVLLGKVLQLHIADHADNLPVLIVDL